MYIASLSISVVSVLKGICLKKKKKKETKTNQMRIKRKKLFYI